jgi:hypothetical protein
VAVAVVVAGLDISVDNDPPVNGIEATGYPKSHVQDVIKRIRTPGHHLLDGLALYLSPRYEATPLNVVNVIDGGIVEKGAVRDFSLALVYKVRNAVYW